MCSARRVRPAACLLAAVALWTLAAAAGRAAGDPIDSALAAFKRFYADKAASTGIVGSSLAMIHDGKLLAHYTYGTAHREEHRPVTERTIYHWASITKTFTAMAIMQLRDRGRLTLEDPIVKYLPELRAVHNPFGDMSAITLRHLLSHSAGFRAGTWPWGGDKPWHPHEPREWSQVVAMLPYTEIEFAPGSRYSYSNPGIVFLGRVIEILSGDDYEVYIDKHILRPLEMRETYFDATPPYLLPHRSHSYRVANGKTTPARFDVDTGITVSNGGLNAPIPDMVKYLSFLLGTPADSAMKTRYDLVLKRESIEEMWQPRVDVPAPADGKGRKDAMGLSFFIEDNYGQRFIAHSGGQNAFSSHIFINPKARAAYVVAFNTWVASEDGNARGNTDALDRELKEHLFEHVFPLLGGR